MELTKEDLQSIVDRCVVEVENGISAFKNNECIMPDSSNLSTLKLLVSNAEHLLKAYEAKIEAEEEQQVEEYELNLMSGLDEALKIKKED